VLPVTALLVFKWPCFRMTLNFMRSTAGSRPWHFQTWWRRSSMRWLRFWSSVLVRWRSFSWWPWPIFVLNICWWPWWWWPWRSPYIVSVSFIVTVSVVIMIFVSVIRRVCVWCWSSSLMWPLWPFVSGRWWPWTWISFPWIFVWLQLRWTPSIITWTRHDDWADVCSYNWSEKNKTKQKNNDLEEGEIQKTA
jgi:hypothetical protein